MKFSQSIEDYLETVYLLEQEKGTAKVKEIAERLGVSVPSTTGMIRKLADNGLVEYKKYGPVKLTSTGKNKARKIYEKHKLIGKFFISIGVDKKTAMYEACLAEHILSTKTIERLKVFVERMD
ncbi:MAG: metal-dependent transcriptional regulator [Candidatus Aenigmatarchaeota archaeon]|nr:MAG: metal-dependent transcriptional regulator [Candidatus Aenigmarchaeota archaeon]